MSPFGMTTPRRHHIIPQMILRRFIDENGFIHVLEGKAAMVQRALVTARGAGGGMVVEILASRGLAFAVPKSANKSFIIGDHPLARMGPDSRLDHNQLELWFPISKRLAVSPWGKAGTEAVFMLEDRQIRQINDVIFHQSNLAAGRSESLMKSLAGL